MQRERDADLDRARPVIAAVREAAPMVHCITATVSMGLVADGLLAAGARPMMTETLQEAPVVTALADALLINFGTLSTDAAQAIPATVDAAMSRAMPWVMDPTAIGVAPIRTRMARELLVKGPTVVRGNASEILALAGQGSGGRGADASEMAFHARGAARSVAGVTGGVVSVSGKTDLVVDARDRQAVLRRGRPELARVTGTGCLLGALVAACTAVIDDPFEAALAASTWMAVAGERAAQGNPTPRMGTFRMRLIDELDAVNT